MTIDHLHFTPWTALTGGLLIGLAAAALVLFNVRIAGVSRILGGLLRSAQGDVAWRLAFVAGLIAAPLAYAPFAPLPAARIDAGAGPLVAAGLLVGLGTRVCAGARPRLRRPSCKS